jgi:WD40 repeat protein
VLAWTPPGAPRVVWQRPEPAAITTLAASADGQRVAVVSAADGVVRFLTAPAFDQERRTAVTGQAGPVAFEPGGRVAAVGVGDTVALVDVVAGTTVGRLEGSLGTVVALAWSPRGDRLWAVTAAKRVVAWPVRAGTVVVDDPARSFVAVVGPDPTGRLAVVARDGSVETYDSERTRLDTFATGLGQAQVAALSRDGAALAVATTDQIAVSDLAGKELSRLSPGCQPYGMSFGVEGGRLYVACDRGLLAVDWRSGSVVAEAGVISGFPFSVTVAIGDCAVVVRAVRVDPAGQTLLMSGDGAGVLGCMYEGHKAGSTWVWSVHTVQSDNADQARALAMRPDGKLAAIGLSDGTVRFWRPRDLDIGGGYRHFGGEIRGAAFTADGAHLLVATRDGVVEFLPSCPQCGTMPELADRAGAVLAHARDLGLTTVLAD